MSKSRRVKYYLRNWGYYDKNLEYLGETEEQNMKVLYSSLKQITKQERKFFAEKYRVFDGVPVKDEVLARKHDMTLKQYRKIRIQYETKLLRLIEKAEKKYKETIDIPKTIRTSNLNCRRISIKEIDKVINETIDLLEGKDLERKFTNKDMEKVVKATVKHVIQKLNISIY